MGVTFLQTPCYEASITNMIRQERRFENDYVQPASELQALTLGVVPNHVKTELRPQIT